MPLGEAARKMKGGGRGDTQVVSGRRPSKTALQVDNSSSVRVAITSSFQVTLSAVEQHRRRGVKNNKTSEMPKRVLILAHLGTRLSFSNESN